MVNPHVHSAKQKAPRRGAKLPRRAQGHIRRTRLPSRHEALKGLFALSALALSWYGGHQLYTNWGHVASGVEEFVARHIDAQLQDVMVSGVIYADPEALRDALKLQKGSSLVGFDAQATRQRLQEVTWVKAAAVTRELPSTIRLEITEYTPLARLDVDGDVYVIDRDGVQITKPVLGSETHNFQDLPVLRGLGADKAAASLFYLLETAPRLAESVRGGTYIGNRRWDLHFDRGVTAKLPEKTPEIALEYLKRLQDERQILNVEGAMVDLRLEDRIVLRLPPAANGHL